MAQIKVTWKTPVAIDRVKMNSGMSDPEFEVRFGVSPIELEAAHNGRDTISPWSVQRIIEYFGLTAEDMFCEMA